MRHPCEALGHPTVPDNVQKIAIIRQAVSHHMSTWTGIEGMERLHHTLHQVCQVFPPKPQTSVPKPWQTQMVQHGIKAMWDKWRAVKQVRKNGLRGCFHAWRAWKAYDRQYRQHQQHCLEARRAKLLEAMQEAQLCAFKHDSRGLCQIVKRLALAPKQAYRRMQLKDSKGLMLTPTEEADLLQSHFSQRFKAAPDQGTPASVPPEGPWFLHSPLQRDPQVLCACPHPEAGLDEVFGNLALERITNLAALQLIGMQICRESLRREGLANEVQKLLHSC